jgi:hypothetical protein
MEESMFYKIFVQSIDHVTCIERTNNEQIAKKMKLIMESELTCILVGFSVALRWKYYSIFQRTKGCQRPPYDPLLSLLIREPTLKTNKHFYLKAFWPKAEDFLETPSSTWPPSRWRPWRCYLLRVIVYREFQLTDPRGQRAYPQAWRHYGVEWSLPRGAWV